MNPLQSENAQRWEEIVEQAQDFRQTLSPREQQGQLSNYGFSSSVDFVAEYVDSEPELIAEQIVTTILNWEG